MLAEVDVEKQASLHILHDLFVYMFIKVKRQKKYVLDGQFF